MLRIEFSAEDQKALSHERYHGSHPVVRQRMEVVWLKSQGLAHNEIARLANVTRGTVRNHLLLYQSGGIEALKRLVYNNPESDLEAHRAAIEAYFKEHPPASVREAQAAIEKITGIKRCPESVRIYMRRIGLRCRRTGVVPAKADPVKQEEFKKNTSNHVWRKPRQASA